MQRVYTLLNSASALMLSGFIFFFSLNIIPSQAEVIKAYNLNNLGRAGMMEPVLEIENNPGLETEYEFYRTLKVF